MRSVRAQAKAMARDWPHLKQCDGLGSKSVVWFGELRGLERPFYVSIQYGLPMPGGNDKYRRMPLVRVLKPLLVLNWNSAEESPLPHVYFEQPDIRLSPLCLFDPMAREWDSSMLISRTTIVWTMRWLAAYELWEATGRWIGGGRHDEYITLERNDDAA